MPPLGSSPATALTLEASSAALDTPPGEPCKKVQFVAGSCPHLATETDQLLRVRLRGAALCVGLALASFLIWRTVFQPPTSYGMPYHAYLHYLHVVTTAVLVGCYVSLRRTCPMAGRWLRGYELVIFALPAVLLLAVQYESMRFCAEKKNYLPSPAGPWLTLIFTYALFIPNSWRRAAVVLGSLAAAPLVLTLVLTLTSTACRTFLKVDPDFLPQTALILFLSAVTGVLGTHAIGTLRAEAYEARQLGQYRLVRRLGAGGMGEVYLAEHQMMKRPCAIKIIRPDHDRDPRAIARFEREVRATARLSHWNTIEIFDYGRTEDGTFYYVMEYLPGLTLAELVDRFGPLPAGRVVHLLAQTCDALAEAHAMGLVHRDIKPGNIFSAQRGGVRDVAKLLDFGLAKPILEHHSAQLTQEGFITGSPLYMSPEQATGDSEPDGRSDIYSLGAVAYFLLTGAPPFDGDKPLKVIMAHAQQPVLPPRELRDDIPADLEQVVLRCLAKRPEDRFPEAAALAAALRACAVEPWGAADADRWWRTHLAEPSELAAPAAA
jgi:serine/threonine-protein kinase